MKPSPYSSWRPLAAAAWLLLVVCRALHPSRLSRSLEPRPSRPEPAFHNAHLRCQPQLFRHRRHRTRVSRSAGSSSPPPSPLPAPALLEGDGSEMPKIFDPTKVEAPLYEWWDRSGFFQPTANGPDEHNGVRRSRKPYVVPMPPPNVTGYLHMGHAIFVAIQDIFTRFRRMLGQPTLYLPGTDHAGIATQLLVERSLEAEGITRESLGREAFLERVWQWKDEKGGYISEQMRELGASADWTRLRFTLEPSMSAAVTEAFFRLHEKGLIYRGEYLVNWSPQLQTAVSDLEVEYSQEEGKLYHFKYMLAEANGDGRQYLPVATTRPETILGDTAVCVHPEDPRYAHLIGKSVVVPTQGRSIPVIADTYVDREFGTGALKITPAHDPNDYEIGKRHNLPLINIMNKDGTLNANAGAFEGLDRFDARDKLWSTMGQEGLTIKVEPHTQRVPRSQRGGEVIEPLISRQWFVKTDNMAKQALDAATTGKLTILPTRFNKIWSNWLSDLHDWCISRQLWWGHRIPVWYLTRQQDGTAVTDGSHESMYVVGRDVNEAVRRAKEVWGEWVGEGDLRQDEDVLDTWFSSGLWPFATVGWPHSESDPDSDLARYYPATVLETGYDILFFWVARMVMLGIELTGEVPFSLVYLHGLVRDAEGQKMSKTKGNVVDPLDTTEKYGADALRYTLVTGGAPGQDIPLQMERVEANRNFANKLWNVGRYVFTQLEGLDDAERSRLVESLEGPITEDEVAALPLPDRHIVSMCHVLIEDVTRCLLAYNVAEAGKRLYEFIWDELADWYVGISSLRLQQRQDTSTDQADQADDRWSTLRVLLYVLLRSLMLLHPFMPYVTESLWQILPHPPSQHALIVAPWPAAVGDGQQMEDGQLPKDQRATATFQTLQAVVRSIRAARADYKVEPGRKIAAEVQVSDAALRSQLTDMAPILALFARIDPGKLAITQTATSSSSSSGVVHLVVGEGVEVDLPMADLVDVEKERQRLERQRDKVDKELAQLTARLGNKGFIDKAPAAVVAKVRAEADDLRAQLEAIGRSLEQLNSAGTPRQGVTEEDTAREAEAVSSGR
ncbi:unnamed protein product [Vitrella brassicaformis CCMP3155]|uniref:valine--tRNA ligase n=5 Tax=Vitrella brassicaformis TaxID=1169539 RepID=A0A0G4F5E2_VITBC|nr:unnamed protein product [Vitrella brassicaformis CCMP3155]|eukprot:CEM07065.1 unnamed protein product [Vitrella brassicaformis CCMP3155]